MNRVPGTVGGSDAPPPLPLSRNLHLSSSLPGARATRISKPSARRRLFPKPASSSSERSTPLLGENGAGKSTLVSIAAGASPRRRRIFRAGRLVAFRRAAMRATPGSPSFRSATRRRLLVADNLALSTATRAPSRARARANARVARLADAFGLSSDPDARADTLPSAPPASGRGALAAAPDVLILDSPPPSSLPTSDGPLHGAEKARRRRRRDRPHHPSSRRSSPGPTTSPSSHAEDRQDLPFRDDAGRDRRPAHPGSGGEEILLEGEEGRGGELAENAQSPFTFEEKRRHPNLVLTGLPEGLSRKQVSSLSSPRRTLVLLAIDGNGADLIASAVAAPPVTGEVRVAGAALPPAGDPLEFRAAGGAFVPADRREEGLVLAMSLAENLALPHPPGRFLLDRSAMNAAAHERIAAFAVRADSPFLPAGALSGGNQQKLVLARELAGAPRLVVAIHPTRGLDLASSPRCATGLRGLLRGCQRPRRHVGSRRGVPAAAGPCREPRRSPTFCRRGLPRGSRQTDGGTSG